MYLVRVRMSHMAMSAGGPCLDLKWFLVKTKALNETRVYKRLTGAGYEVLFPKISRKSKRHRGLFEMRPLFPTYLFVRFDGDELKTIKYTHGVARVICFGPEPQEVDEGIIVAGLDAIFVEEMPDRERVVLLLDAVSSYKLTIEKDSLER